MFRGYVIDDQGGGVKSSARKEAQMKLHHNIGIGYRDALDGALRDLQKRYKISRSDARFLLADALMRNCVWDEIINVCDWQFGKEANNGTR